MTKKFRVAIIGCGQFGSKRAKAIHSNQHTQLVGVFDPDQARAQELANVYQATCYPSLETLLADTTIDGVVISSPNYLHTTQSITALLHNKHVLCEKPAGIETSNFNDLTAVIDNGELQMNWQYGYNHRFFEPVLQLKQWLDEAVIGKIETIELTIASGRNKNASPWFTDPTQSGGGTLIDNGHHLIDLLLWLLPGQWRVVTATTKLLANYQVEEAAQVTLIQNTVHARLTSKWQTSEQYLSIKVKGERGTIVVTDETAILKTTTSTHRQFPLVAGLAVAAEIDDWLQNSIQRPAVNAQQNLATALEIYDLITSAYTFSKHDSR